MTWISIKKNAGNWIVRPNLINYEKTYADFSWEIIRRELSGQPDGKGLNIAYKAIDRHADGLLRDHLVADGNRRDHDCKFCFYRDTPRFHGTALAWD